MKIRGFLIILVLVMGIVFAVYFVKIGGKGMLETEIDKYKQVKTDLSIVSMDLLAKEIMGYTASRGEAPAGLKDLQRGRPPAAGLSDGWGRAVRYEKLSESGFRLTSAGQDGEFGTPDDLSKDY